MQLFRRANQSRILLESMNFIKGPFKASIKEDIKPFDLFTDNPYAFCVSLLHARVLQDLVEWIFYNLTSGIRLQATRSWLWYLSKIWESILNQPLFSSDFQYVGIIFIFHDWSFNLRMFNFRNYVMIRRGSWSPFPCSQCVSIHVSRRSYCLP